MTDTAIGRVNKPLDIKPQSILQSILLEDDNPEIEIVDDKNLSNPIPTERKHKTLSQQSLEERIKRFKDLVAGGGQITRLPDDGIKLRKAIKELEEENTIRKAEQEKLALQQNIKAQEKGLAKVASVSGNSAETRVTASKLSPFNGVSLEPERRVIRTRSTTLKKMQQVAETHSKNASKGSSGSESPHSEEIDHGNYPSKGKGPSLQPLYISEKAFYDRPRNKGRTDSGEQAGPSSREALRSGQLKACNGCNRKVSPTNRCSFGNGSDSAFYCPSCSQSQFLPGSRDYRKVRGLGKDSDSSDEDFTEKCSGAKRRRSSPNNSEPVGSVVELFSSDDEEKDTEHMGANIKPVRTDQHKGYSLRSSNAHRTLEKLAYPSKDDPEAVEVEYHDLQRLAPMEFLNDTIIDFYIKYLQRPEFLKPEDKERCYFFNSFFYKKLFETASSQQSSKKQGPDLSKLRKWTKGTNIFEKDYLFVPIHDKWHWSLAIICNPGGGGPDRGSDRCILHLDSMSPGHKSPVVFKYLKMYLSSEWAHQFQVETNESLVPKVSLDISTKKVPVPQQDNESDCGLFLLHYIDCFLQQAPTHFKLSDLEDTNLFGRTWFKPSAASQLRQVILSLLEGLFDAYEAEGRPDKEPIENTAVQFHRSPDSPAESLQVSRHELESSAFGLKDTQVVERPPEGFMSDHSPGLSSTDYVSVKASPSTDTSACDGSQHANGIGLMGSDTGRVDSAAVHPVDSEAKENAVSEPVELDHSQSIADQSLHVYVELGDMTEMDSAESEKVKVLKGSTLSST